MNYKRHRHSRTGRAGWKGRAITFFVDKKNGIMNYEHLGLRKICFLFPNLVNQFMLNPNALLRDAVMDPIELLLFPFFFLSVAAIVFRFSLSVFFIVICLSIS